MPYVRIIYDFPLYSFFRVITTSLLLNLVIVAFSKRLVIRVGLLVIILRYYRNVTSSDTAYSFTALVEGFSNNFSLDSGDS